MLHALAVRNLLYLFVETDNNSRLYLNLFLVRESGVEDGCLLALGQTYQARLVLGPGLCQEPLSVVQRRLAFCGARIATYPYEHRRRRVGVQDKRV